MEKGETVAKPPNTEAWGKKTKGLQTVPQLTFTVKFWHKGQKGHKDKLEPKKP